MTNAAHVVRIYRKHRHMHTIFNNKILTAFLS